MNDHVMDFRFIHQAEAHAVISCKSYLRSTEIEEGYCTDMKEYVGQVWLFSECCGPRSPSSIQQKAQQIGYDNYWHLYTWSKNKGTIHQNLQGWDDFVTKVKALRQ